MKTVRIPQVIPQPPGEAGGVWEELPAVLHLLQGWIPAPLQLHSSQVHPQVQHLLLLTDLLLLKRHLVGFLLRPPLLFREEESNLIMSSNRPVRGERGALPYPAPHLALLLDGLFPGPSLLPALLLITRLCGDAGQV